MKLPLVVLLSAFSLHASTDSATWRERLIEDWGREATVMTTVQAGPIACQEDAVGGCDGIKDGKWGFHTSQEDNPWWQVDLGQPQKLDRIVVWNRCDGLAGRNSRIKASLSIDGSHWQLACQNESGLFYGATDNKPLVMPMRDRSARFVRLHLDGHEYLHLDEVEVFGGNNSAVNLALHCPASQSSVSTWSAKHTVRASDDWTARTVKAIENCRRLAANLRTEKVSPGDWAEPLSRLENSASPDGKFTETDFLEARRLQRKLALANPLLDFDDLLFVKQAPGTYSHMSDQFYGWWSRPGGGIFVLKNFKSAAPAEVCLTSTLPDGSFLRPDLSFDGRRILFACCKYYPRLAAEPNKTDKSRIPEDAFYHLYEMSVDGTGLRQLTHGSYNDFDGRYLPNGEIVFLSTRRGQSLQTGKASAMATVQNAALPDSYVRCGGGDQRPVAVFTLHTMKTDGSEMRAISAFENFEWTPSVADDGRILYARWDYVDRHNQPFMGLWSTNPDGTNPQLVYKNFARNPLAVFEARSVPHSGKIVFTASAHHSITAGSLVLLDPSRGNEDAAPIRRLTPEVCFPEAEGWPSTWYASPYPLSEDFYLTAWSHLPLKSEGQANAPDALGLYFYDAAGARELLYRDPAISSLDPIPLRARATPPAVTSTASDDAPQEGNFLVLNASEGLPPGLKGKIKSLRVVAVPAKTQPQMNVPSLGVTSEDPGKCVLGTVPVEADGSAYFRVPSGVNLFLQALDEKGFALQTMRTITYVQPGQTLSCVGCHEPRQTAPQNTKALAAARPPVKPVPESEGSWPIRFDRLVQPILDAQCAGCHRTGASSTVAASFDISPVKAYETLVNYGKPSLRDYILARWNEGRSTAGEGPATSSLLLRRIASGKGHENPVLDTDGMRRLVLWMDTYAQRLGAFSPAQEEELRRFKEQFLSLK
jgi:hypothetical protein